MSKRKNILLQAFLFGIVGVVSLLIDVAVTTALYSYAHLPAYLAGSIGFLSAFFFNFPVNRKHVFNHTNLDRFSLKTQMSLFAGLCFFNLGVTALLMDVMVDWLGVQVSLAKIAVTALIAVWNFLLFRYFIFSKQSEPTEVKSQHA